MKLTTTLANSLLTQTWAIKSSELRSLLLQYSSILQRGEMPCDPEPGQALEGTLVNGVYVLPIFGILTNHTSDLGLVDYQDIITQCQFALNNEAVDSIFLYINSPGGWTQYMFTVAEILSDIGTKKPLYAYVDGMCCSAAYIALANSCNAIYCSMDADIGSIGVFSERADQSKMLEDMGIKINVFASHPDKVADHPEIPLDSEHSTMFQADVNEEYQRILTLIKSKRNLPDTVLTGWSYKGIDAVNVGMADGIINTISDAVEYVSTKQAFSVTS